MNDMRMNKLNSMRESIARVVMVVFSLLVSVLLVLVIDYLYSNFIYDHIEVVEYKDALEDGWYALKKNHNGYAVWGDHHYKVYTDKNGYRVKNDQEDHGKANYLFLGDSFTFGVNGSWDETFVGMFSKETTATVLNAGVPSYSPTGYLYQYQQAVANGVLNEGYSLIIGVDISDVQDEAAYWADGDEHPINKRREMQQADPDQVVEKNSSFKEFKRKNFKMTRRVSRYVRNKVRELRGWKTKSANDAFETHRSAFTWKGWNELEHDLKGSYLSHESYAPLGVKGGLDRVRDKLFEIAKLAKNEGARVYLLIYPWPSQLKYKSKFDWPGFIEDACSQMKCDGVIDTTDRFAKYAKNNEYWYKDLYVYGDTHYNTLGNRLVADELAEFLND